MTGSIIRIENLIRDFGPVRAVDNLTLEIPPGIVFGFLGPNGAGKTTTIRLLLGLLSPTQGTIEVLGKNIAEDPDYIRENTGALLEHNGLYERLSAEENLDFYGRIWKMPSPERRVRIKTLLTHFELLERQNDKVGSFSKGMKQKLAVARAMLHNPRLIFLDEPTAGLDPVASARLREDIAGLAANEGTTVFLTTHNLSEADKICGRIAVINKGKLVATGIPDELKKQRSSQRVRITGRGFVGNSENSEKSEYAGNNVQSEPLDKAIKMLKARDDITDAEHRDDALYIDLADDANMSSIISLLIRENIDIEEIIKEKASLEEVFLKIMAEEEKKL
ncbi:ATP-binding cassette domain-containing protein [Candidatus Latescibacterota bacterium]